MNWITRKSVTSGVVGVEPPPEPPVELLRAVDIRDGDDDHLELHVHDAGSSPFDFSGLGHRGSVPNTPTLAPHIAEVHKSHQTLRETLVAGR